MKLTPLYPPSIKPVRSGVYKVSIPHFLFGSVEGYAHYSTRTKRWGKLSPSIALANSGRFSKKAIQEKSWRGLAKEPK